MGFTKMLVIVLPLLDFEKFWHTVMADRLLSKGTSIDKMRLMKNYSLFLEGISGNVAWNKAWPP